MCSAIKTCLVFCYVSWESFLSALLIAKGLTFPHFRICSIDTSHFVLKLMLVITVSISISIPVMIVWIRPPNPQLFSSCSLVVVAAATVAAAVAAIYYLSSAKVFRQTLQVQAPRSLKYHEHERMSNLWRRFHLHLLTTETSRLALLKRRTKRTKTPTTFLSR
jgi:hypothetical protein